MAGGKCSEHVFIFLITNSVKKALQKNFLIGTRISHFAVFSHTRRRESHEAVRRTECLHSFADGRVLTENALRCPSQNDVKFKEPMTKVFDQPFFKKVVGWRGKAPLPS